MTLYTLVADVVCNSRFLSTFKFPVLFQSVQKVPGGGRDHQAQFHQYYWTEMG